MLPFSHHYPILLKSLILVIDEGASNSQETLDQTTLVSQPDCLLYGLTSFSLSVLLLGQEV